MNDTLADHVFDACLRAGASWPRGVAEVLELLAWMTDDDAEITDAVDRWLQSADRGRVQVALEIEDWFPFQHREEMAATLAVVKARWPEFARKCDRLLERREAHPEPDNADRPHDLAPRLERLRAVLQKLER